MEKEDLDALLDDALGDFDKPGLDGTETANTNETTPNTDTLVSFEDSNRLSGTGTENVEATSCPNITENKTTKDAEIQQQEAMFEELFAGKGMDDMMKELMSGEGAQLTEQLQKLAEMAGQGEESEESQHKFTDTLKDTLHSLSENAEKLEEEDISEDEIMKMMSNLAMGGGGEAEGQNPFGDIGAEGGFMNMMQGMMRQLLSKDVLYPSLKDLSHKYPTWLDSNKEKLSKTDYENYRRQLDLIQRVCEEYEAESDTDTDAVKQKRIDRIQDYMQKMQDCGQPPKELIGETGSSSIFGQGLPTNPEACSIM